MIGAARTILFNDAIATAMNAPRFDAIGIGMIALE
jgi:hypothetical protein